VTLSGLKVVKDRQRLNTALFLTLLLETDTFIHSTALGNQFLDSDIEKSGANVGQALKC